MDKLMEYWYQKNSQEQTILAVVAGLAVLFLIYLLIVGPLLGWRNSAEQRYERNRQELAEVQQLAAQVKAKKAQPGNSKKSNLSVLIDKSLRENDLEMRGFQPGSNQDARLRLENAAYPSLMQWLYDLEYRHGIHVDELSLTPAQASGRLMVSVRVSQ